jgi:hypothetical protein
MTPVGPLKTKRIPEAVRRRLDMAAAAAWEAVVDAHVGNAIRFIALAAPRLSFHQAVNRYLSEMDVRDPMASAIRSRVLIRMEGELNEAGTSASEAPPTGSAGLKRFRPDVVARGIARKVRETEAFEERVRLAIARAEEGVLLAHIENAVAFTEIVQEYQGLDEGVEDYIDLMRITGGRAQSVYQRAMARLADLYLPPREPPDAAGTPTSPDAAG